ncbi:HpcH/HpaI aldolase family protein [Sandarakinorhabdus sp. DWP1-3-1]|uniref:HpcH/HpaI aldolase family protein n=1 Tax=Sandarakinorhabdus sp. DWP1-3-1 TaxID=2804627 RepID=UPI003CF74765
MSRVTDFREALRAGDLLAGTWVKTPHPHNVEVLALSSLDCLVLDGEHAPFDRAALDLCIMAARAGGMPVLVRPASAAHEQILSALDCGADGVVIPHIRSVAEARAAVRACHYVPGGRGYAGSSRAAAYTTLGMAGHRAAAREVIVIAQIEDAEAVDAIDEIAAVAGIDALFIGRADLTISMGAETMNDAPVVAAVERICAAGQAAGRTVGMFLGRTEDVPEWRARGASLFLLQSDQDFLLQGAARLGAAIRAR